MKVEARGLQKLELLEQARSSVSSVRPSWMEIPAREWQIAQDRISRMVRYFHLQDSSFLDQFEEYLQWNSWSCVSIGALFVDSVWERV